jgi:hypothetical protein
VLQLGGATPVSATGAAAVPPPAAAPAQLADTWWRPAKRLGIAAIVFVAMLAGQVVLDSAHWTGGWAPKVLGVAVGGAGADRLRHWVVRRLGLQQHDGERPSRILS